MEQKYEEACFSTIVIIIYEVAMVKQRLNETINDKHEKGSKKKKLLKNTTVLYPFSFCLLLPARIFELIRNTIIIFTINKNNWPDATAEIRRPRDATHNRNNIPAYVSLSTRQFIHFFLFFLFFFSPYTLLSFYTITNNNNRQQY